MVMCGHCHQRHKSVQEVRACSQQSGKQSQQTGGEQPLIIRKSGKRKSPRIKRSSSSLVQRPTQGSKPKKKPAPPASKRPPMPGGFRQNPFSAATDSIPSGASQSPKKPPPPTNEPKKSRAGKSKNTGSVWAAPANRDEARRATPEFDKKDRD